MYTSAFIAVATDIPNFHRQIYCRIREKVWGLPGVETSVTSDGSDLLDGGEVVEGWARWPGVGFVECVGLDQRVDFYNELVFAMHRNGGGMRWR
jgi:hypothetical protein